MKGTLSSVRRILKRGGPRNFRKFEKNKDQKKKLFHSNSVRFFAQNQLQSKKKKGLHSNSVRFFGQSWVQAYNKRIKHTLCVIQARSQKFEMGELCLGAKPPAAGGTGSGGSAPSARKFCVFLQKELHFRAILIKK